MTLYFIPDPGYSTAKFTVNISNASQVIPDGNVWAISLRSELTHTSPVFQTESQIGLDLGLVVVSSNERSTTFEFSNIGGWHDMKNNLKNGIYIYQIGWYETSGSRPFTSVLSGVAKVITSAGQDPTKDIVSYTSNNEDNSGFVYYSETL